MINANNQIIDVFNGLFKEVVQEVVSEGRKAMREIAVNTKQQIDDFIKSLKQEVNVEYKEEEMFNSSKLIKLAKENIVKGSNEVYVWKKTYNNGVYINIAYGINNNLLEDDKNKFIIVKVEALSADLLNMFEESELVILK